MTGSPLIDAGLNTQAINPRTDVPLQFDLQGGNRISGAQVDIGAIETQALFAINDEYSTPQNEPLIVPARGVLLKDTFDDPGTLKNNAIIIVEGPRHGGFDATGQNGGFLYVPDTDFHGTDTFQYIAQFTDPVGITNVAMVTNTVAPPPIAGADVVGRFPSQSVKVSVATLLSNDVDPATGTNAGLSITAVNNPGGSPATVTLSGGTVIYDSNGHLTADTFEYTVQNSLGQTGTVFGGIPGRTYRIQSSEDLQNWTDRASVVGDGLGRLIHTDMPPLPPGRFYRTVSP